MPSTEKDVSALLPSPADIIEEVREELQGLHDTSALEPFHIGWAIDQMVDSGVELPLLMATVLDFAPIEWLGKTERQRSSDYDFDALAAQLGIDASTGRPRRNAAGMQTREKRVESAPTSHVVRRGGASCALGSEGVRQRPLEGWSKSR